MIKRTLAIKSFSILTTMLLSLPADRLQGCYPPAQDNESLLSLHLKHKYLLGNSSFPELGSDIADVRFAPDGMSIAAAMRQNGSVFLLRSDNDLRLQATAPLSRTRMMRWLPWAKAIFCSGSSSAIWDTDLMSIQIFQLERNADDKLNDSSIYSPGIHCLDVSSEGVIIAASHHDLLILRSDAKRVEVLHRFPAAYGKSGTITGVAITASGRFAYACNDRGILRSWDVISGVELKGVSVRETPIQPEEDIVLDSIVKRFPREKNYGIKIDNMNNRILCVSKRWEYVANRPRVEEWLLHSYQVFESAHASRVELSKSIRLIDHQLAFLDITWQVARDGKLLGVADERGHGYLFDLETGAPLARFHNDEDSYHRSLDFNIDRSLLAAGDSHHVQVWEIPSDLLKNR